MSRVMRKPAICIYAETKEQISCATDQRLCFCYIDSTISHLSKTEISILQPYSLAAQPGL